MWYTFYKFLLSLIGAIPNKELKIKEEEHELKVQYIVDEHLSVIECLKDDHKEKIKSLKDKHEKDIQNISNKIDYITYSVKHSQEFNNKILIYPSEETVSFSFRISKEDILYQNFNAKDFDEFLEYRFVESLSLELSKYIFKNKKYIIDSIKMINPDDYVHRTVFEFNTKAILKFI